MRLTVVGFLVLWSRISGRPAGMDRTGYIFNNAGYRLNHGSAPCKDLTVRFSSTTGCKRLASQWILGIV
jgi:hypothetical protein